MDKKKKKIPQAAVNEALGMKMSGDKDKNAEEVYKNASEEQKEIARKELKDYDPRKKMAHGGKVGRGCGAAVKGGGSVMKSGKRGRL